MREVAAEQGVSFVDAFSETEKWYSSGCKTWTIDGFQLTEEGYERFGEFLADEIFGRSRARAEKHRDLIHAAVNDKNWMWHNDYKIPNGVHAYGRRLDAKSASLNSSSVAMTY